MDSIQQQVIVLTDKVDALHQMIDQINGQISVILATTQESNPEEELGLGTILYGNNPRHGPTLLDSVCEHKDVLMDSNYIAFDRQNTDIHLSQDIQIQRLTAQLTAAYQRIAALEEQLLATRGH
ncbi:MAG: hypothetical protein KGQ93_08525 [Cyanobacteria bacterium REEB459]|nr:hypothetical protein [Cyanobacteria bacterium REEB459]